MIDRLRRHLSRRLPTTAALLAALALGACQTNGGKPVASAAIASPAKQSIAFDSIDGPPQPVFEKLVANLSTEAQTRQMPIVSREGEAAYRVRGYLATVVQNGKGEVDWVWDVFDADRERVLRVAGTEKVGPGKDVWNKIDDETLGRIAAQSLDEISTRLAANTGRPKSAATSAARPAVTPAEEPGLPEDPAASPPIDPTDGPAIARDATPGSGTRNAAAPGSVTSEAEEPGAAFAESPAAPAGPALTFAARP
ncbi:hypothetical protein FHS55_002476 [Angulomicrobium tetraedrale]|uniref:Lipoprotein n=1 Tax=Ancylobacter tetraedralis TaxID=217068 RepID=A0A839ZAW1_9HYPH|nr:hypothetical protein [Ancylobacter tetraedralis]MBB3771867.1 hypothetical protein [Ancylobacter tetraedralis]